MSRIAPGPDTLTVIRMIGELRRDPLRFSERLAAQYGDIVKLQLGPIRSFLVSHPEAFHHVLIEKNKEYVKGRSRRAVSRILGQGLITSEGELWRQQRKLIQPAFHRAVLDRLTAMMITSVDGMLEDWERTKQKTVFDLHAEMMRLTLRIIGQTLFSVDIDDEASAFARGFAQANAHADHYAKALVLLPAWVPTPRGLAVRRTVQALHGLVRQLIDEHRARERADLLSMLMAARDEETGEQMKDRQLYDEMLTMIAAGHETTATTLSWCFYLLSKNPEVLRNLRDELTAVLGDRPPEAADLPKLTYTNWVVQETLRLYPSVWMMERETCADDEILGYRVPAGSSISLFVYGMQRHKQFWDDPDSFRPERFAPELCEARPRSVYAPFGAGPRRCIGANFAMMEAQIILAMIAQRFQVTVAPGREVKMDPLITLRPKQGIPVTIRPNDRPSASSGSGSD
jgi:cytochrome P450